MVMLLVLSQLIPYPPIQLAVMACLTYRYWCVRFR